MTHLISTELFAAFLNCKYKAYLKVTGVTGSVSEYEIMETSLEEEYRRRASRHLLQSVPRECVVESPKSIHRAVQQEFLAITNARVAADGFSVRV
jgi:hypothetical protein